MTENLTKEEAKRLKAGFCPDCGESDLLPGTYEGFCQNVKCAKCRKEFNVGLVTVERLIRSTNTWRSTTT